MHKYALEGQWLQKHYNATSDLLCTLDARQESLLRDEVRNLSDDLSSSTEVRIHIFDKVV